jgi:hypothetical protein
LNLNLVHTVGQAPSTQVALIVRREGVVVLVALAEKFDGSLDWQAVRAGDFQAKFSGVALRVDAKGERQNEKEKAEVD